MTKKRKKSDEQLIPWATWGGNAPAFTADLTRALGKGTWKKAIHPDGRKLKVLSDKEGLYFFYGDKINSHMRKMMICTNLYADTLDNRKKIKLIGSLLALNSSIAKMIQSTYKEMELLK